MITKLIWKFGQLKKPQNEMKEETISLFFFFFFHSTPVLLPNPNRMFTKRLREANERVKCTTFTSNRTQPSFIGFGFLSTLLNWLNSSVIEIIRIYWIKLIMIS